jgi:hypothetical protein
MEIIFNSFIEIKGMGRVSAKYRVINELLTKKSVLNFFII